MIDDLSVFADGGQSIPIKAGSLRYTQYVGKKTSTPVVNGGVRGSVSSRTKDDDIQTIMFNAPRTYNGVDVVEYIRTLFDVDGGVDVTIRNNQGVRLDYVNMVISDSGETEDNGEPFIEFTLSGTHVV
jgi:hypothetical protein